MYDRILVPTDGSDHAERAATRAFELAETTGAAIDAISVAETGPLGSVRLPGDEASASEVLTDRARTFVDRLEERATDRGLVLETEVRTGVPVREILEYADEIGADAVVMGTRGRGGVGRLMLGSVADGVMRHGDQDVLVVGEENEG
ncbi:universal stress protein [Halobiforma nitratireducens]|uniref:UspA domain-containing protein n=1 Tax=Halobiforma nitratireducens JCM 10879 TaxID=1227454 RepID=M0LYA8_9EURY|nr:universal stress protein [Halobiforma nitratireducens]EMA37344.1 UspA domain-containing protein [Halobiforma nitratireducens JCM 10879]